MMKRVYIVFLLILNILLYSGCSDDSGLNVPVRQNPTGPTNEIDEYIQENFLDEYNVSVVYRFVDEKIAANRQAAPPREDIVIPMLEFIEEYWFEPYLSVENGEEYLRRYITSEIILIGGPIFENGTVLLGLADAGARITFTNVNDFDLDDEAWLLLQLRVTYHEFAHVMHQNFRLPVNFEQISPEGYTSSGSWFTITNAEALQRGFVTNYATSNPNEDFADTMASFIWDPEFQSRYLDMENCFDEDCVARNEGRVMIAEKLLSIKEHWLQETGIDLDELRAALQAKL